MAGRSFSVVIPGQPVPASRPRVSKWGTHYSKTYTKWKKSAEKAVPRAKAPLTGLLACTVLVMVQRARTSKLSTPRGDCDNFAKGPLDVLTRAGYWLDDNQITSLTVHKRFTQPYEEPSFYVHASELPEDEA